MKFEKQFPSLKGKESIWKHKTLVKDYPNKLKAANISDVSMEILKDEIIEVNTYSEKDIQKYCIDKKYAIDIRTLNDMALKVRPVPSELAVRTLLGWTIADIGNMIQWYEENAYDGLIKELAEYKEKVRIEINNSLSYHKQQMELNNPISVIVAHHHEIIIDFIENELKERLGL